VKNLALAAVQHRTQQGSYPTCGWGFQTVGLADKGFGKKQPGGWVFSILPFAEQQPLWELTRGLPPANQANLKRMVETPITLINCPTRRPPGNFPAGPTGWQPFWTGTLTRVARSDYAINGGTMNMDNGGSSDPNAAPSIVINDGVSGRAWGATAAHIRDGLSNTYLIGEKYIDPRYYQTADDYGDNENAYIGSDRDVFRNHWPPAQDRIGFDNSYAFGSAHTGNFQMGICDGAVRSISYSIDTLLHQQLCTRADGVSALVPNP
jgi:hypothetical protein